MQYVIVMSSIPLRLLKCCRNTLIIVYSNRIICLKVSVACDKLILRSKRERSDSFRGCFWCVIFMCWCGWGDYWTSWNAQCQIKSKGTEKNKHTHLKAANAKDITCTLKWWMLNDIIANCFCREQFLHSWMWLMMASPCNRLEACCRRSKSCHRRIRHLFYWYFQYAVCARLSSL